MSFTASLEEIVAADTSGLLGVRPGWQRARLGDVASILNGFAFRSSEFSKEQGTPLLRIRDVVRGVTQTYYRGTYDPSYLVQPGDLVVGMDGDFNCALWAGPAALLNQRVCKITPDETRLSMRFLVHVLPGYLAAINAHTPSLTVKHLSSRTLADIPLPCPPIGDQEALADELDAQLTRLEAGVAALERVQANLKRYRAAVLRAACEGRLVPTEAALARQEGRPYEHASVLLERIRRQRALCAPRARSASSVAAVGSATGHDGLQLPEGWVSTTLGSCCPIVVGATPSRKQPGYWGGSIPWVSSGEVQFCRIASTREHITDRALAECGVRLNPVGSVLLGMIGEGRTRGQAAILDIEACNNQNCAAIWASRASIVPEYLYHWLSNDYSQTRQIGAGNNQKALNKSIVEAMRIPLPPLAEQQRIVAEVERRLSLADCLNCTVDASLQRSTRLRKAVLAAAFGSSMKEGLPVAPSAMAAVLVGRRSGGTRSRCPRD